MEPIPGGPCTPRTPSMGVGGSSALSLGFVPLAPHYPFLHLSFFIYEMGLGMPVPFMVILVPQKQTKLTEVPWESQQINQEYKWSSGGES